MTLSTKPIQTSPAVLVLVTDQMSCERLILAGRCLADQYKMSLEVVNVAQLGTVPNPEAMEFLYQVSRENDAVMTVEYCEDSEKTLITKLKDLRPSIVVTGLPGKGSTLLQRLWTRFEFLSFYTVEENGEPRPVTAVNRAMV